MDGRPMVDLAASTAWRGLVCLLFHASCRQESTALSAVTALLERVRMGMEVGDSNDHACITQQYADTCAMLHYTRY